jgi:predicted DCC family thiol-disulfide oxidoreductase YuxK
MKVYYNSACPVCKAGIEGQMQKGPLIKQLCRIAYNAFSAALYKWNRSKKHW